MKFHGWLAVVLPLFLVGDVQDQEKTMPPTRVGQIFIVGNTMTRDAVVRYWLDLYPGQELMFPHLRIGERNLAQSGLFVVDRQKGIRPTVTVLDNGGNSGFKDLLVQVKEKDGFPRKLHRLLDLPFQYFLPLYDVRMFLRFPCFSSQGKVGKRR